MKLKTVPPLLLAIVLQIAPICRVASVNPIAAPSGQAMIFQWLVGAVALLGSFHAVSGASSAIAGVASVIPPGPVTSSASGTVGQSFDYRIVVSNPGTSHSQDFWNAAPLPPGLTINTNVGGNGYITGIPTEAGTYAVALTAGNMNSPQIVHKEITIDIQGPVTVPPPSITTDPTDLIVPAGTNVILSIVASGQNLTYQWQFNSNNIAAANASTLRLSALSPDQSGFYSVVVTNSGGSVTSRQAQLLVVPPPSAATAPSVSLSALNLTQFSLSFATAPGYRYIVEYSDSLKSASWTAITNIPPAFTGSAITLPQNLQDASMRFYRVLLSVD